MEPKEGHRMAGKMYPHATHETVAHRRELAPEINDAWSAWSKAVFTAGAVDAKTKQLIAVAVAHTTQCPYCIRSHTKQAARAGASESEIMEAIWVAAEMRSGGAVAHSTIAFDAIAPAGAHDHVQDGAAR
jgi:AhpD family alkylhydroperoxidase